MRERTRVQISPSTLSLQLASSTGSLCPKVDEATAKPDEAMPFSSRILVEFRGKQEKKLVSCIIKAITELLFYSPLALHERRSFQVLFPQFFHSNAKR